MKLIIDWLLFEQLGNEWYILLYTTPSVESSGMTNKATQFKKGFDAKRYVPINQGLVEFHTELSKLLRDQSLDAVSFLVNTMNDDKASLKLRVTAAHTILDRGLGKPVDRVVLASVDSGGSVDPATLDTAELERIITKLDDKSGIIEGEFKESQ